MIYLVILDYGNVRKKKLNEPNVGKTGFASHTNHTMETTNMELLHSWEITCNLEF